MNASTDTKPRLHSKTLPWINEVDDHWMYNINIEQMTSNLMNTEEHGSTYRPLQKRLMINFTKEACGRGGEVKFQKYSEWNYNNYFGIMDRRWFDMKN